MKLSNFIFDTFMKLTSKTVPYGFEDKFFSDVLIHLLPDDIKKDQNGNYFYKIGNSRTIFASHIDTVSKEYVNVTRKLDADIISTDGKTTLGADDKAGMTVMLWMIKNRIPGLYYFFIGEEVGCIGSGLAAKYEDISGRYDRIISFDRRGTNSVITFQSYGRCCSDKFADSLCYQLNKSGLSYKKDTGGVYTDSAEFMSLIPECTNISVGYYKEHTTSEYQDIKHLERLALACTKVDWENLPTYRNANEKEQLYNWDSWGNDFGHGLYNNKKRRKSRRGKKRTKSRSYLDGGFSSLYDITKDISSTTVDDKYEWVLNKFIDNNFTKSDLNYIKDNYLDLSNQENKWFFEYLQNQVI